MLLASCASGPVLDEAGARTNPTPAQIGSASSTPVSGRDPQGPSPTAGAPPRADSSEQAGEAPADRSGARTPAPAPAPTPDRGDDAAPGDTPLDDRVAPPAGPQGPTATVDPAARPPVQLPPGVRVDSGIAAGAHQRLDVYWPEDVTGAPALVLFGDEATVRSDYAALGGALAAEGVVTVIADYRVEHAPGDADCALEEASLHLGAAGADSARIAVAGHGFGAIVAVGAAMRGPWVASAGRCPFTTGEPVAIVTIAGAFDRLDRGNVRSPFRQIGGNPYARIVTIRASDDQTGAGFGEHLVESGYDTSFVDIDDPAIGADPRNGGWSTFTLRDISTSIMANLEWN